MGLGDKVKNTLKDWIEDMKDVLAYPVERGIAWAIERFMDKLEPEILAAVQPSIEELMSNPATPDSIKAALGKLQERKSAVQFAAFLPYLIGILIGAIMGGLTPAFRLMTHETDKLLRSNLLMPQDAIQAYFRESMSEADLKNTLSKSGIKDADQQHLREALRRLPGLDQIRDGLLREFMGEGDHDKLLSKYGLDAEAVALIKQLYKLIPNPQDLIRMAVREVFSPEIAARFGQFDDFPAEFEKYAAQLGISAEWAKNYWAAHWDLPSPMQGFEMLHRGVISKDDLMMLLRALDVMPFWRDKLTEIAYNPYTRVDARRMFKLEILDREQVKQAYRDLGYNEEKAENLTKFTEEWAKEGEPEDETTTDKRKEKQRDLTTSQIMDGYKRGYFTESEARASLTALGYDSTEVDYYLALSDYNRDKDRKEEYISNIKSLYVTGVIAGNDVLDQAEAIGISSDEIEQLLEVWQLERVRRVNKPSRSDLDAFLKAGIIDEATYRSEMYGNGYSDKYIDWYLARLTPSET